MSEQGPAVFPGEVHGLRSWTWEPEELLLSGPYSADAWRPGGEATTAACSHGEPHDPPAPGCGCGLYGIHPHRAGAWLDGDDGGEVLGIVAGWGRVEVHADGFRAERGRPVALAAIGPPGDLLECAERLALLEDLAARYSVPLLRVGSIEALVAHCREQGLGLAEETVAGLLGSERGPEEEEPDPAPVAPPPPARPVPPSPQPPSPAERVAVALKAVGWGLLMIPIALWYAFWGGIAVVLVLGLLGVDVGLWDEDPPPDPPPPAAGLEIEEERLIPAPGEVTYIAVVRNTSEGRAALGVSVAGSMHTSDGETLNEIDPARHFDSPASLLPGERGVVVDTVRSKGASRGWAERVRELRTVPQVRKRVAVRGDAPRVSAREAIVDTGRCVLLGRLRSQAPAAEARVVLLSRNRKGLVSGAWWGRIGPLERGSSTKALLPIPPEACAGEQRPPELELRAGLPRRAVAELAVPADR